MDSKSPKMALTKEQQKYVYSKLMDFATYTKLVFGIIMILSKRVPFMIFGIFMTISFIEDYQIAKKINKGESEIIVGRMTNKYEKNPSPHASKIRTYMAELTMQNGMVVEEKIDFYTYRDVELGKEIIIINTGSRRRIFVMKEEKQL